VFFCWEQDVNIGKILIIQEQIGKYSFKNLDEGKMNDLRHAKLQMFDHV
jgi:hypothetical protein